MPNCPLCLYSSPEGASVCEHCGRYRFREDAQQPESGVTLSITRARETQDKQLIGGPDPSPDLLTSQPRMPIEAAQARPPAKLVVIRGSKLDDDYPIYEGANYLGRTAEKPADIDLSALEPPEKVWASRQHAVIHCSAGTLSIEDLNSLNGTFVNRARIHTGRKYVLKSGDVIQIGTIQLKVVLHS